jgi:hypothetical protein
VVFTLEAGHQDKGAEHDVILVEKDVKIRPTYDDSLQPFPTVPLALWTPGKEGLWIFTGQRKLLVPEQCVVFWSLLIRSLLFLLCIDVARRRSRLTERSLVGVWLVELRRLNSEMDYLRAN